MTEVEPARVTGESRQSTASATASPEDKDDLKMLLLQAAALVPSAIAGTLIRVGFLRVTAYPGAPVPASLYPQVGFIVS